MKAYQYTVQLEPLDVTPKDRRLKLILLHKLY